VRGETEMNSWLNVGSVIETSIVENIKIGYKRLPEIVEGYLKTMVAGASPNDGFDKPCKMIRLGEAPLPEHKDDGHDESERAPDALQA
jgi:hypothetical protein